MRVTSHSSIGSICDFTTSMDRRYFHIKIPLFQVSSNTADIHHYFEIAIVFLHLPRDLVSEYVNKAWYITISEISKYFDNWISNIISLLGKFNIFHVFKTIILKKGPRVTCKRSMVQQRLRRSDLNYCFFKKKTNYFEIISNLQKSCKK